MSCGCPWGLGVGITDPVKVLLTSRTSAIEYYPTLKNNELDVFPGDLEELLLSIVKWEEQD